LCIANTVEKNLLSLAVFETDVCCEGDKVTLCEEREVSGYEFNCVDSENNACSTLNGTEKSNFEYSDSGQVCCKTPNS
jgi:hypothetical protein